MFIESLYVLCPTYIWVGLMGGGSYVNVLHRLRELDTLSQEERESAMSLALMFNDAGILVATIFSLILGLTVLSFWFQRFEIL